MSAHSIFSGTAPRSAYLRALAAANAALHSWRSRARERARLAALDAHEGLDLPYARELGIANGVARPFWPANVAIIPGRMRRSEG